MNDVEMLIKSNGHEGVIGIKEEEEEEKKGDHEFSFIDE